MLRRTSVLVALAACGGGGSQGDDTQQPMIDAPEAPMIDAPPPCKALGPCAWLDSYERHIVGVLAGAEEVTPGVKLAHRASVGERNAARQFLLDAFTALGYTAQRQDYNTGMYVGANVVATLEPTTGTGTVPTLIVGAHFDGVPAGPAAADNGTGVAMVMAAARFLRDVEPRQHRIVFALFDQEELGLVGSREYVKTITNKPDVQAHIFDMVSYDGDGDHAVELWSPTPSVEALYQAQAAAAGTPVAGVMFDSSDHQAFLEAGIAATGVSEEFAGGDHTPNYHKSTDTYENVQFDHLERVTHLAFAVLEAAAK